MAPASWQFVQFVPATCSRRPASAANEVTGTCPPKPPSILSDDSALTLSRSGFRPFHPSSLHPRPSPSPSELARLSILVLAVPAILYIFQPLTPTGCFNFVALLPPVNATHAIASSITCIIASSSSSSMARSSSLSIQSRNCQE